MFYHLRRAANADVIARTQPIAAWPSEVDRNPWGEGCQPATWKAGGAREGTRTPTPLLASGPKPGASTNFATLAVLAALPGRAAALLVAGQESKKAAGIARLRPLCCPRHRPPRRGVGKACARGATRLRIVAQGAGGIQPRGDCEPWLPGAAILSAFPDHRPHP
ncbi:hypothetical protein CBM2608_A90044 [Cupriavidus taiwanensis]|nr:hypothetical protein CBM2608_A90044 [Cupriavidus taiwanensis]SPA43846.1 hypothetical protein CBM2629_A100044 [Cupriavidus taiwanensis]